jgi:hypothetical protein
MTVECARHKMGDGNAMQGSREPAETAPAWGPGWSPLGRWAIPGATAVHRLDVVCGILGSGKIQGWLDGQLSITLDKPKSLNPVVISGPGMIDGRHVVIYAESADGGLTVHCDVFVDGRSLDSGEPLSVIPARASTVHLRSPEWISKRSAELVWPLSFVELVLLLRIGHDLDGAVLAFILVLGANFRIAKTARSYWLRLGAPGQPRKSPLREAAVAAATVACLAGVMAAAILIRLAY